MMNINCSTPTKSPSTPPPPQPPSIRHKCNYHFMGNLTVPTHYDCMPPEHYNHHHLHHPITNGDFPNGYTDGCNRNYDEDDSAYPVLLERDFLSLHRNVPGLRRAGVDTNAIRQHFYPDGGWGWIVCGVAFLAHVLTSGFQLSYGFLLIYAMKYLKETFTIEAGWIGPCSWAISMLTAPIVIALCRRKLTRLTAVLGGLIFSLGILFGSFATKLHQVAFSFGIFVGIGASMVRESSTVMLGHYFKRRRHFVEMIAASGEGVGIALFSAILKEGVGKIGWRLGLQAVTGLVTLSFFMGLLYRPASLYHPQRRAIIHLKNQRKKVKEKKTHIRVPKPPFIDFSPLKSSTVRMLIMCSSTASFGIYTPIFFMSSYGYENGFDMQDLVLIQTFVGLSIAFGVVTSGAVKAKLTQLLGYKKNIFITEQYICQGSIILLAVVMMATSIVSGYRTICILAWMYGFGMGAYRYSLKMFALERVRARYFTRAWGFIRGAESIPILIGVPFTAFLNDSSVRFGKAGYYVCAAVCAISAILMFFVSNTDGINLRQSLLKCSGNGSIQSHCTRSTSVCPDLLNQPLTKYCKNNWNETFTNDYGNKYWHCHHLNQPMIQNHCMKIPDCQHTLSHWPHGTHSRQLDPGNRFSSDGRRLQKSLSFAFQTACKSNSSNFISPKYSTLYGRYGCPHRNDWYTKTLSYPAKSNLQYHRSRSVPEGLAEAHINGTIRCNGGTWSRSGSLYRRPPIHVVEQITTSV